MENLELRGSSDAQRVTVWWNGTKFSIYNWYQAPSDKTVTLDLGSADYIFQRTIVAGDAYAHHPAFGYKESYQTG